MFKCVILPECDDFNRGDQALVWESKYILEKAGYEGKFELISSSDNYVQTLNKGIGILAPIIEHPSRKFKNKDNIHYGPFLYFKWGVVAVSDFIKSVLLLIPKVNTKMIKIFSDKKKNTFEHIQDADVLIVKGGGFLHCSGGIASIYKIYYLLYHINLALALNKKIIFMPNSYGPLNGLFVKKMVKYALSKAELVMARESISQEYLLNKLNIKAKLYPDLAFYLKKSDVNYKFNTNKKIVGITVRPYRFSEYVNKDNMYKKYVKGIAVFVEWLSKNNYEPILIEHTYSRNYHEQDIKAIQDVYKIVTGKKPILYTNNNLDCEQLKGIYSKIDYIVGTRFHSVIFSLAEGKKGIAITYGGNKGKGIMKDIGLEKYCIDISKVNGQALIELFKEMLKDENEIENILSNYEENLMKCQKELISDVKKVL